MLKIGQEQDFQCGWNKLKEMNLNTKLLTALKEAEKDIFQPRRLKNRPRGVQGIYLVTAQAFSRETGEEEGSSRTEEIDVDKNQLFKKCQEILDIHDAYENFWNHMNSTSALVFVSRIIKKK